MFKNWRKWHVKDFHLPSPSFLVLPSSTSTTIISFNRIVRTVVTMGTMAILSRVEVWRLQYEWRRRCFRFQRVGFLAESFCNLTKRQGKKFKHSWILPYVTFTYVLCFSMTKLYHVFWVERLKEFQICKMRNFAIRNFSSTSWFELITRIFFPEIIQLTRHFRIVLW